jgi:hypothetical protein
MLEAIQKAWLNPGEMQLIHYMRKIRTHELLELPQMKKLIEE